MTTSEHQDEDLIVRAAALLRKGELVAFPTETVYGLGADASNQESLRKLYAAKGRPADHPVIVHLSRLEQVHNWAVDVPKVLDSLARQFWPGPLTVVLKRNPNVLDQVTGGQDTVALRIPAHPLALALLHEFGGGLAAPSANRFGRISPTRAEDVAKDLGDAVSLVLDGGACQVGIESTILDLSSNGALRILRPGMITASEIESVAGVAVNSAIAEATRNEQTMRVPGALASHYAPQTPLVLLSSEELNSGIQKLSAKSLTKVAVLAFHSQSSDHPQVRWHQVSAEPEVYARDLYWHLRRLDALQVDCIVVERPPAEPQWSGINDRLRRAAHTNLTV